MTSQGRLYALALAIVVFFLAWATVASHPWAASAADPRLRALAVREAQLRRESVIVREVVASRWAAYRARLKLRQAQIAVAKARATTSVRARSAAVTPPVRIVTLPPHVITRTS
jgi:hypothetical protein